RTAAVLSDAVLTLVNLIGANLNGVRSGGITYIAPPILPTDWISTNGYLIGPGAVLTNADLTGANLTGADLTGATLIGATLTGATGAAQYTSTTTLPAGFDPVAAGWTLIS
ncbi:unnamed protein product, partial [marine sediment metagenome]